jgi:hypothetical protein
VVLQTLEAEAVLAGQRETVLHFVVGEADGASEGGSMSLVLLLQIIDEELSLVVNVFELFSSFIQILFIDHSMQIALCEYFSTALTFRRAAYILESAQGNHIIRPMASQAGDVRFVLTVQCLQLTLGSEADDAWHAQCQAEVPRGRDLPPSHRLRHSEINRWSRH